MDLFLQGAAAKEEIRNQERNKVNRAGNGLFWVAVDAVSTLLSGKPNGSVVRSSAAMTKTRAKWKVLHEGLKLARERAKSVLDISTIGREVKGRGVEIWVDHPTIPTTLGNKVMDGPIKGGVPSGAELLCRYRRRTICGLE